MVRVGISGRVHDEARVVSIKFYLIPMGGIGLLRDRIASQLDITGKWAEENGAFIGHAKAYIRWGENEAIVLSNTGGETEARGSQPPAEAPSLADIGVTVIVFGIDLKAAEEEAEGLCLGRRWAVRRILRIRAWA
jgi:hypothetical protein